MKQSLREFLNRSVHKPQFFLAKGRSGRLGYPDERRFSIQLRRADGDMMEAIVSSEDVEPGRMRGASKALGIVRLNASTYSDAADLLEGFARAADPSFFKGTRPSKKPQTRPLWDSLKPRIERLAEAQNRAPGEAAPLDESCARFQRFLVEFSSLVPPAIFSSREGFLKGRWQHGADRTLWIAFPPTGPLPLTCLLPREGSAGAVRMHGRCIHDQDIPQIARLLGVPILL